MIPRLLPDVPHLDDRLGGAHKQVAVSIAKLIRTSDGGKSIRLDGTWGTGKSTVVKLLTGVLEEVELGDDCSGGPAREQSTVVFQYDAWVHDGDPLRRAFMTSLLLKLASARWITFTNGVVGAGTWERELAKLGKRLKVSSKTVHPNFDHISKLLIGGFIALGAVAPTIFSAVSEALRDWAVWAKFSIALSSWVVLTGLLYFSSGKLLNIAVKRAASAETTETIDEAEPTSIEFQETFGNLLAEVLRDESRRLVIIIDNLDRIDEKETLEVWSLLRSFLDNPSFSTEPWFRRLWVLVPLATSRLPESEGSSRSETNSRLSNLDKIFQVTFTVPPPLLHSWKNYLAELLTEAFGEDETGDYDDILRLYEELPPEGGMTPRAMVTFVNKLVAAKVEWDDAVPLSCHAAYQLAASTLDVSSCQPPEAVARVLRLERLNDIFAMLHYRAASLDDASYLTLSPDIEKLLDAGDSAGLAELLKRTPSGRYVLDKYIRSGLQNLQSQQERLLQSFCAIAPLCETDTGRAESASVSVSLRRHLVEAATSTLAATSSLHLKSEKLIAGIDAFFAIVANDLRTADVLMKLLASLKISGDREEIGDGAAWQWWKTNLTFLLGRESVRRRIEETGFQFVVPVSPAQWAEIVDSLQKREQTWALGACESEHSDDILLAWVNSSLESTLFLNHGLALLKQLVLQKGEPALRVFIGHVAQRMSAIVSANPSIGFLSIDVAATALSAMIQDFREYSPPMLHSLAENGVLFSYIAAAQDSNQFACKFVFCLATYIAMEKTPLTPDKLSRHPSPGQQVYAATMQSSASRTQSEVTAYSDVVSGLQCFDLLPDLIRSADYAALGRELVIGLASDRRFIAMLTSGKLDARVFAQQFVGRPELMEEFLAALSSSIRNDSGGK